MSYGRRSNLVVLLLILLALVAVFAWVAQPAQAQSERIFAHGFEEPGAPGPPIDPCVDELVAPAGWVLKQKTWVDAFSAPNGTVRAVYPQSVGSPVPVPGFEQFSRHGSAYHTYYLKGQIVAIPFVALPEMTVRMTWDTAQANQPYGYGQPRPAHAMFVGISPCMHDLRTVPRCTQVGGLDSLFYSTRNDSGAACRIEAGGTYYINIAMADPRDGLEIGEHTCSAATNSVFGCDVQMKHGGN